MHLTRDALLALAESPHLPADPHLASCARCRDELATLRVVLERISDAEIPEPSPLFWEHFSHRVRIAIAEDADGSRGSRWTAGWRSWTYALGASAATVIVVMLAWTGRPAGPPTLSVPVVSDAAVTGSSAALALPDDEAWELVVDIAGSDDVGRDTLDEDPAPVAAEMAVQDLSSDERTALVTLLRAELVGHATSAPLRDP